MIVLTLTGADGDRKVFEVELKEGETIEQIVDSLLEEERKRREASVPGKDEWLPGSEYARKNLNRCFQRPLKLPIKVTVGGAEQMVPPVFRALKEDPVPLSQGEADAVAYSMIAPRLGGVLE